MHDIILNGKDDPNAFDNVEMDSTESIIMHIIPSVQIVFVSDLVETLSEREYEKAAGILISKSPGIFVKTRSKSPQGGLLNYHHFQQ